MVALQVYEIMGVSKALVELGFTEFGLTKNAFALWR